MLFRLKLAPIGKDAGLSQLKSQKSRVCSTRSVRAPRTRSRSCKRTRPYAGKDAGLSQLPSQKSLCRMRRLSLKGDISWKRMQKLREKGRKETMDIALMCGSF